MCLCYRMRMKLCKSRFRKFLMDSAIPILPYYNKEAKLKIFELFRTAYFLFSRLRAYLDTFYFFLFNDFECMQCEEPIPEFSTFYLLSFVCNIRCVPFS